jgi:hypothetical protein
VLRTGKAGVSIEGRIRDANKVPFPILRKEVIQRRRMAVHRLVDVLEIGEGTGEVEMGNDACRLSALCRTENAGTRTEKTGEFWKHTPAAAPSRTQMPGPERCLSTQELVPVFESKGTWEMADRHADLNHPGHLGNCAR